MQNKRSPFPRTLSTATSLITAPFRGTGRETKAAQEETAPVQAWQPGLVPALLCKLGDPGLGAGPLCVSVLLSPKISSCLVLALWKNEKLKFAKGFHDTMDSVVKGVERSLRSASQLLTV